MGVLENSVVEAHSLANAAISALEVPGSEDSLAYTTWFGPSKCNPVYILLIILLLS